MDRHTRRQLDIWAEALWQERLTRRAFVGRGAALGVAPSLLAEIVGLYTREVAAETGSGGAATLKQRVIDSVIDFLGPIRERRAGFTDTDARRLLRRGVELANEQAEATLREVREAMSMAYKL